MLFTTTMEDSSIVQDTDPVSKDQTKQMTKQTTKQMTKQMSLITLESAVSVKSMHWRTREMGRPLQHASFRCKGTRTLRRSTMDTKGNSNMTNKSDSIYGDQKSARRSTMDFSRNTIAAATTNSNTTSQRRRRVTMNHVAPQTAFPSSASRRGVSRAASTGGITKETQESTMSKLRRVIFNEKKAVLDKNNTESQAMLISEFVKRHLQEIANDRIKFRRFQKSLRNNRTNPTNYLNSILSESSTLLAKVDDEGNL